jgi:secreted PhoX family phosphatase
MQKESGQHRDVVDHDDVDTNLSANDSFAQVLAANLKRRAVLKGGVLSAASVLFGSVALSACGSSDDAAPTVTTPVGPTPPAEKLLGFTAVAKSLADSVIVPAGYTAKVVYALGDPLTGAIAPYRNDGTDDGFENRSGDHHDGMELFGLSATGTPSATSNERVLLAINHEATTDQTLSSFFIHANGGTRTLPRPAAEVDKEVALHGVAVVEVARSGTDWKYVQDSTFNRRVTPLTDVEIAGPARGSRQLVTKYSGNGTRTRGTLNNCGTGKTPWNSFLTGEENWVNYFTRVATDDAARADKSVLALQRYGKTQGAASRHGWESAGTDEKYARWNISKLGASADGSDDHRNGMNGMGFVVEMDPYDKSKAPKKRTALGRVAHESAAFGPATAGQPLAVYMGDDSRNEYIYKFVSAAMWAAADANPADRLATGDKYLDSGALYVAKFNADGTGRWLPLSMANAAITGYAAYRFDDLGDICINTRLAADAAGATRMDRPEWCSTNPANGEVYFSLTNNSNRRVEPEGASQSAPDGANPRVYTDMKGSTAQPGNPNGHIIRIKEGTGGTAATAFTWDIFLFGAETGADQATVNLSKLSAEQDFSSPDGLAFSPYTGLCWIQTDDGAYTDVTNCMMLAAITGTVGDGARQTLNYPKAAGGTLAVDTFVGKAPTADSLKRFLVGPAGCELTGICETPDGKTMFVNIQHPGENTDQANLADPAKYTSQWPSNAGYGNGKRPRSATIVITKNDGGRIGS